MLEFHNSTLHFKANYRMSKYPIIVRISAPWNIDNVHWAIIRFGCFQCVVVTLEHDDQMCSRRWITILVECRLLVPCLRDFEFKTALSHLNFSAAVAKLWPCTYTENCQLMRQSSYRTWRSGILVRKWSISNVDEEHLHVCLLYVVCLNMNHKRYYLVLHPAYQTINTSVHDSYEINSASG